jgi:Beta-galactosidase/beta-glucuronidase
MSIQRFQAGWYFKRLSLGSTLLEAIDLIEEFEQVELPHDWLIEETTTLPSGSNGTSWYRKVFTLKKEDLSEKHFLKFDGIYMDSTIYINRQKACEWKNGYTSFEANLTPYIKEGENEILVSVNYQTPNSRWYSGAGIYRSVWLRKEPNTYFNEEGTYIVTKKESADWKIKITSEVETSQNIHINYVIREWDTKKVINKFSSEKILIVEGIQDIRTDITLENPTLWDLENPFLYELLGQLIDEQGEVLDTQVTRFGFRGILFDSKRGFFLNEKNIKIQGVCEHHDFGCLGAAFNIAAMKRKFDILKEMGVNAIRISHNMPAKEVIELADEMGFLLVTELYDMWERPKTEYDFARFFKDWYKKDVASWVRRDRNAPSIILWSIGNEIYDTHMSDRGLTVTRVLMNEVLLHDSEQNAKVTLASNYMPWENTQKCADVVKVIGYNYSEKYYEEHHKQHPDWVIYGSETASIVQSRGIYRFPQEKKILVDDDKQCSALGNSITSWGAPSTESCIITERDTPYSLGQFLWTGFDYIGEPTPYHTKSSYLGQIDTAGFPKDAYYIYQSAWTSYKESPMVHIYPYWDFNEGQIIDINICSNAPEVELFKNGISQGKRKINHQHGTELVARWKLPYEKGEITAVAYDEDGVEIAAQTRKSFGEASKIRLSSDKEVLRADGRDLCFITIEMLDDNGYLVENANNRVEVTVTGAGRLIGLDNGDSTDYDEYKGISRRLFSGKLLAVVAAKLIDGEITVQVSSRGMAEEIIHIKAEGKTESIGITAFAENKKRLQQKGNSFDEIPIRKIELLCKEGNKLTKEKNEISLEAVLHPINTTYQEVEWSVTDDMGIPSKLVDIKSSGKHAVLSALGDGSCRVRCMAKNGTKEMNLISQIEVEIKGFGTLNHNPYEFIYGGTYTYAKGTIGNGNERGIATARDGESQVGFTRLDFGAYGSDEVTIPIFALSDEEYPIQIWEGIPYELESSLVADIVYQKPSKWNVYQEDTVQLNKRLRGVTSLYFVLRQKVHIKGFIFTKQNRGMEKINVTDADAIYGDSFTRKEDSICGIGNNVSLEFLELDFGTLGISSVIICGNSEIDCNSIHLCFEAEGQEEKELLEFTQTNGQIEKTFQLSKKIIGKQKVTFLFLPGSKFDFTWFQFEE